MFAWLRASPNNQIKPIVLVVMDGFGIAPPNPGNAIHLAKTPNYDRMLQTYPWGQIIASGEAVGLPANEVGNSEVGHLTLGVGRVIFQSLERINRSIKNHSIYTNQALVDAFVQAKTRGSRLHLMGLVGSGNVHSSMQHLEALLELARQQNVRIVLHAFTDGRDSPPTEAAQILSDLEQRLQKTGVGEIATVSGRYYAMDRDARWERINAAYAAIVLGKGKAYRTAAEAAQATYAGGKGDEFIEPALILGERTQALTVRDNDVVIYFNFRVDRARELTMALTLPDFEHTQGTAFGFGLGGGSGDGAVITTFNREYFPRNLHVVTMTEYQKGIPVAGVAFPPEERLANSLTEVFAKKGWRQLHLAESEKERMVTYYFDGAREDRFEGEEVDIVTSPKVATYDLKPEMALPALTKRVVKALGKDLYQVLIVNFANPDMVAHTGNIRATINAIEKVDAALGVFEKEVLARNGLLVVTADHGNAEELITYPPGTFFYTSDIGTVNTDHSNYPIPLIFASRDLRGRQIKLPKGNQADVAPTLLSMLGIPVPTEMTGRNLLEGLA